MQLFKGSSGPPSADRRLSAGGLIEGGTWRIGLAATFMAVVACGVFAATTDQELEVFATATILFLAAGAAGLLAGFVFGLPREAAKDGDARQTKFFFNSNLIKVSDWLTTIIVGITLVNVRSIGSAFGDLAVKLGPPLGGEDGSEAFGLALVIFGFVVAAILMYLWSTLRLRELLEQSEQEAAERVKQAGSELKQALESHDVTSDEVKGVVASLPAEVVPDLRAELEADTRSLRWGPEDRSGLLDLLNERIKDPSDPASGASSS